MRQGTIYASKLKSKEDKIRERSSYSNWKALMEGIRTSYSTAAILRSFHTFMDSNHLYGTAQQSSWSEESLALLIQDDNLEGEQIGLV